MSWEPRHCHLYTLLGVSTFRDSRLKIHTFVGASVVYEEIRVLAWAQAEEFHDFALQLEDGDAGAIEVDAVALLGSFEVEYYV
jgi:hypothetical protein